jgi:hypothetical protein
MGDNWNACTDAVFRSDSETLLAKHYELFRGHSSLLPKLLLAGFFYVEL